jgi:hypothetical protein
MVILAMLLGLFIACTENPIESTELTLSEQYTKIFSRDGFWMWDSTYAEEYIQFEDSLYLGYNKTLNLHYYRDGTFQVMFIYQSIDKQILIRKSFSDVYQWSVIEENEKWSIKYILPNGSATIILIMSLNNEKLVFEHRTYNYVSNE